MSELPGLSVVTDINDRGEVLGLSDGRPVVWAHGIITPLALPPGEWGVSTSGINNLGHAVGTIISAAPGALAMAVLWRDGAVIPLPPLVANESTIAYDINNRGEIVGWTQGSRSDLRRALLWVPQTPTTPPTTPGDVGPVPGTPQALPTDLGTLGGNYSTPTGINDNGVIVGSSTTSGKEQHGFAWMPANGMVDLGTFGNRSAPGARLRTSVATAVSNTGEVVGASYVATGAPDSYQAFLWTSSAGMQILGTPTVGLLSDATAINDVGQVLGNNGGSEVWTATGGWVDIGTLGGGVRPVANNNLGQVVGTSSLGIALFPEHAFVWTSSGGMVDLGTLGGPSSAAAAVNQSGHVVGWAQTAGAASANNWRAFLWTTAGGMVNLGSLGGSYSVARDVNELDMVVGTSAVAPGAPAVHAFIWTSAAGMRDLGTLGGIDSEAYAVSDAGMVVGRSSTPGDAASHAFVWTPSSGMVDLVPLAGYTDSVAYLVNSTGTVVGSSYDRVSGTYRATMWVVPVAEGDVTPPTLFLPETIVVDGTSPAGATVTYVVSASDDVDPSPTVTCSPLSGSVFPLLATTVSCTATDAAGNSVKGMFDVVVKDAPQQLADTIARITSYDLLRLGTSLLDKLQIASGFAAAGQVSAACDTLAAFLNQVRAQTGKGLTVDQATELRMRGIRIRHVIGC
jgi:probable HAF family extracellular repeat protein